MHESKSADFKRTSTFSSFGNFLRRSLRRHNTEGSSTLQRKTSKKEESFRHSLRRKHQYDSDKPVIQIVVPADNTISTRDFTREFSRGFALHKNHYKVLGTGEMFMNYRFLKERLWLTFHP